MRLTKWLAQKRIKRTEFAEMIGVSPSYVTAVCQGKLWPGRDMAITIKQATGGKVTPNDLIDEVLE